jgi:L-asparaginase
LYVPEDIDTIKKILKKAKIFDIKVKGLIYKDSLDLIKNDRKKLVKYINKSKFDKIIIIHGTDTMNITASYLDEKIKNKQIVLTGSMVPFSINPIEATSNFMIAYGFLNNCKKNNIYISMHGKIEKYNKIFKNKQIGVFEWV